MIVVFRRDRRSIGCSQAQDQHGLIVLVGMLFLPALGILQHRVHPWMSDCLCVISCVEERMELMSSSSTLGREIQESRKE